ncbi:MAG: O-antigen ligase family protein [Microgenomates group bacterium]
MKKISEGLIFLYLVLFPFGQLARLPIKMANFPEVNIYLTDLIIGVSGLIGLIGITREKIERLAKLMIIFLGIAGLSLIVKIPFLEKREILVSSLYWLRLTAYFGFYLLLKQINWQNWQKYLLTVGGATAIFGLIQYFFWPDLRILSLFGWDDHFYRLVGTFLDPNFTGIILVLTLILIIENFQKKAIYYFLLIIGYLSLALTYSRASYLAFLGGIASLAILKKKIKIIPLIILIIFITVIILPRKWGGEGVKLERVFSIEARVKNWYQAMIIFKDNPLLGVGFNTYRYTQRKYGFLDEEKWLISHSGAGVDNSFLFILATTGILGGIAVLFLLREIFCHAIKKSPLIFASLVAVIIHSFFNNTLFYPWVMGWLAIILSKL